MSLTLGDETTKVFLNTKGRLNDVDEEMKEFLTYIENSTEEFASCAKSDLVKVLHHKVNEVKHDKKVEVEYMTLLERDREKYQEGIEKGIEQEKAEIAKALLDILDDETIADKTGLDLAKVKALREALV